jgi:hypothetical protein
MSYEILHSVADTNFETAAGANRFDSLNEARANAPSQDLALDSGVEPRPDVVDLAVRRWDQERLVHGGNDAAPEQRGLGDDRERRVHLIAVDGEVAIGGGCDDPVLRTAIQTAPQVVSGKPGLDALLDANAVRRERHRITVVAGKRVDVGLGRRDAVCLGDGIHQVSIG